MPQYDDTFLDSPIFRRRTRSYAVQKEFAPKSSSFVTATPLLLAVTNHARTLSGSLSTCSLKGNKGREKEFGLRALHVPYASLKRGSRAAAALSFFLSFFVGNSIERMLFLEYTIRFRFLIARHFCIVSVERIGVGYWENTRGPFNGWKFRNLEWGDLLFR